MLSAYETSGKYAGSFLFQVSWKMPDVITTVMQLIVYSTLADVMPMLHVAFAKSLNRD